MNMPDFQRWKQLSPLLDELFDLDVASRQGRLAELRKLDPAMADDLEAMLRSAAWAEQSDFLASNAQDGNVLATTLVGEQIGAYVIEALLGQGGTGSVWRARRTDGRFEGAVAIKLLHMSLIGRTGALRFEREGAILARLTHPHIARLLDAGVTSGGQPYLVLELVEGEPIDRHCDVHRLGVEQRLLLFDDVLSAVAQAHSHLVIHRDIKPTNILVTADGNVKLLDFGIAKLLLSDPDGALVTADGQRALTPEYAAPEQLQGAPVTTATDVYALGVLLYHLLVGRHPTAFEGASSAEVIRATLETDPLRLTSALSVPSAEGTDKVDSVAADRNATLPKLRRQLRGDLENIVARALRKSPSERYQTVVALADDLRRYRQDEPVSARPESLAYRSAKFVRRRRGWVVAALVLVLAVSAGLTGTLTQARRAQAQAARAQHERDNALRALGYAQVSSEFITFLLEEGSDKPFTTSDLLARAEPVLEQQVAGDPAQRAHLRLILGVLFLQANYMEKAEALFQRARIDARDTPDVALQAEIECQLARLQGNNGTLALAQPLFEAALVKLRAAPELDRATLAQCLQGRSEVASFSGEPQAALDDARAALEALGIAGPTQRLQSIGVHVTLASALGRMGQAAESVHEYERAITELETLGRGHTVRALGLYNNLGVALSRAGQTLRAVEVYRKALDIARGFGSVEPALAGNYANRLIELGRSQEAIPLIEHALAEAKARGDHRTGPVIVAQGARAWCFTHQLGRCAELLSAARSELTLALPAGHTTLGTLETTSAQLALARSDPRQARAALNRAVDIFGTARETNLIGIRALTLLARTELQLGDLDAAEAHARRAETQARQALAGFVHSEWLGSALVAQGMVQKSRGESVAARTFWSAALTELLATLGDSAPATVEVRRLLADS